MPRLAVTHLALRIFTHTSEFHKTRFPRSNPNTFCAEMPLLPLHAKKYKREIAFPTLSEAFWWCSSISALREQLWGMSSLVLNHSTEMLQVTHGPRAEEGTLEESWMENKPRGREQTTELGTAGTSLQPTSAFLYVTILHTVKWKNSGKGF